MIKLIGYYANIYKLMNIYRIEIVCTLFRSPIQILFYLKLIKYFKNYLSAFGFKIHYLYIVYFLIISVGPKNSFSKHFGNENAYKSHITIRNATGKSTAEHIGGTYRHTFLFDMQFWIFYKICCQSSLYNIECRNSLSTHPQTMEYINYFVNKNLLKSSIQFAYDFSVIVKQHFHSNE